MNKLIEERSVEPIKRRLTNLSEMMPQNLDTSLPRFSKRTSIITGPGFSFSSGNASGLLNSFNSSAMKNTLKIESTKDQKNLKSMGNILEELDEKESIDSKKKQKELIKRHSFSLKKKGLLTDDSMNQSQNDSFYAFQKPRKTDGEKQRKGKKSAILMESSHLTPLSEKSKSSHANDMKLKEESVASKNLSKNIEKEESIKVQTIDSKAIRLRNIRQKRKTNVVFQSMEDTHKPQKRVSYHQKLQNTLQNPEFLK